MKRIKHAATLLLALVLACGLAVTAYATDATTASLDFSQTGSVALTLADSDGNTVSGGAVTIYEVAALYLDDGNMAYAYTDAFSGCTATLDVEDTSLAATLASYVSANGISGTTAAIGSDGTVTFSGLELGLYLVVQTTDSDNYETINPFLVTVPMESDGAWLYDVDASPKVGAVTPIEPEEEEEEPTTTTTETTKTTTSSKLPQTGQLNWPVPVLAVGGLALFALGWGLNRSGRKREGYAD
ncbi:MAG: peptidase [Clostridiales bacterium]|nr:peptidase [Clostridiales bacterium]